MLELLVLRHDEAYAHELAAIFRNTGYQIVDVKELIAQGRQLGHAANSLPYHPQPETEDNSERNGVTIFDASALHGPVQLEEHRSELLSCILSLARQLNPGWRLSMRERRLGAPNGQTISLTSLEFNFLKIFSMVEVNEAVSRKKIVKEFGEDYLSYDQNRIDTMVKRLRKKIETQLHVKLPLNTERVRGFSFGDVLIIDP